MYLLIRTESLLAVSKVSESPELKNKQKTLTPKPPLQTDEKPQKVTSTPGVHYCFIKLNLPGRSFFSL